MTKRGVKINPLLVLFLAGSAGNSFVNLQGTARCLRFGCLGHSREEEKGRLRGCGVSGPNFLSLLSSGANLIKRKAFLQADCQFKGPSAPALSRATYTDLPDACVHCESVPTLTSQMLASIWTVNFTDASASELWIKQPDQDCWEALSWAVAL